MTQHRRRGEFSDAPDPTAAALELGRRGDARHPGLLWEAIVENAPAESCSGQLEALLHSASEYACPHVLQAVQRDGWPSIAHYRSVTDPSVLRCGQCISASDREAIARPEEHVRACDCCGTSKVTAGFAYLSAGPRTVFAWLCQQCADQRVPGMAVLASA
jgi:hypothetical protein